MPFYSDLTFKSQENKRTLEKLKLLKVDLNKEVPKNSQTIIHFGLNSKSISQMTI